MFLRLLAVLVVMTAPCVPALGGSAGTAGIEPEKLRSFHTVLLEKDPLCTWLKSTVAGPKITAEDLAGRTVLVILGNGDTPVWNEFMVRMGNQYIDAAPPGGIVTLFVLPEKSTAHKFWLDTKGSTSVTFCNADNFAMPGLGYFGGPRYLLFDADGKMAGDICHDGRDLSGKMVHTYGGKRFTPASIKQLVESNSGSVLRAEYKECAELARALADGALTSAPLTGPLNALKVRARDTRAPGSAEAAKILDDFRDYCGKQMAVIERNIASNPVLVSRVLKRMVTQLAGDKDFSTPFEKLSERLRNDKAFQDELRPAAMLCAVRTQAASISWGIMDPDSKHPKETVQAIKQGLDEIIAKYPHARAALSAAELKDAYTKWAATAIDSTPW